MALKEYTLTTIHGTETTVQLDADDVERYGDRVNPVTKSRRLANKQAEPENKQAEPENKSDSQSKRDEAVARAMNNPTK